MTSSIKYQNAFEVLTRKRRDLEKYIEDGQQRLENLKSEMEAEKADVDKLENEGFTSSLLKLLGRYEGKLSKEQEEYLKSKLKYERQIFEMEEMAGQLVNLNRRIEETAAEMDAYQKSLDQKYKALESMPENAPDRVVFEKFAAKERELKASCTELEEAMKACKDAIVTKNEVILLLESAESWATWDAWAGGGLLTDMVKYEKLDAVQLVLKKLQANLNFLKRELADVDVQIDFELSQIDETTKFFDIWFDNFFTDMKVKAQILAQLEVMKQLSKELERLENSLDYRYQTTVGHHQASIEALESTLMH